jgi:hypothetical protein
MSHHLSLEFQHTVQLVPEQETAGNSVLCPILFPCVELTLPNKLTLIPPTLLVNVTPAPYAQSLFVIVNVGRAAPERM